MGKQFVAKYHHTTIEDAPTNWIAMRKYNGRQAVWDGGLTKGMTTNEIPFCSVSDKGKKIKSTGLWSIGRDGYPHVCHAPYSWYKHLPLNVPLCGELWLEDDLFKLGSIVATKSSPYKSDLWKDIVFIPFHIKPYTLWDLNTKLMNKALGSKFYRNDKDYLTVTKELYGLCLDSEVMEESNALICTGRDDVDSLYAECCENKWEGLIFANPDSRYPNETTTKNILKFKMEYEHEVIVLAYIEGNKKNEGRCGSVEVQFKWGENAKSINQSLDQRYINKVMVTPVSGGLLDEERGFNTIKKVMPIGSTQLIKFNDITNYGMPQHARFIR